jgi:hypothetical protein
MLGGITILVVYKMLSKNILLSLLSKGDEDPLVNQVP